MLVVGAIAAFALGVVSAPRFGAPGARTGAAHPALTVSLDLLQQVRALQQERGRLQTALADSAKRVAALEKRTAAVRQGRGEALAERDAELAQRESELAAARARIASLTERVDELRGAHERSAELSEKVAGLQRARDEARARNAALAAREGELQDALRNNAAMAEKMEGLRRARDEAGRASAAHLETIAALRRDVAAATAERDRRQQELEAEISILRGSIERKDREIASLRKTVREIESRPPPSPPATAPPPAEQAPAAAPSAAATPAPAPTDEAAIREYGSGVLGGAAAYNAGDYAAAYRIWRPLAEEGNARAQFHIGALYFEGRGVGKDLDAARMWLGRSSANGSSLAGALLNRVEDALQAQQDAAKTAPASGG